MTTRQRLHRNTSPARRPAAALARRLPAVPLLLAALALLAVLFVGAPSAQAQQGHPAPQNVQVVPGDGTLTVTWDVSPRDGFDDHQIRHALRWSQEPGVWANPADPEAGGREDGVPVDGGVYSYTITGLENGVATGVFVRSFTGGSLSERSPHSSPWVRIKGDDTTPGAPVPQEQTPPEQQAQPQQQTPTVAFAQNSYFISEAATSQSSNAATVTVNISPALTQASSVTVSATSVSFAGYTDDYTLTGLTSVQTGTSPSGIGVFSGTLSLPANAASATFTVTAVEDATTDGRIENIALELTAIANAPYALGNRINSRVDILDNSLGAPSGKTFDVPAAISGTEGGDPAVLTVRLGEAAPAGGVSFTGSADYTSGGASAADAVSVPVSFTVAEGETELNLSIPLVDDSIDEDDESFTVTVTVTTTGWSRATGSPPTTTVAIVDDDTAGVRGVAVTLNVNEGATGRYRVWLNSRPSASVTVTPSSSDPGAVTLTPSTLTFSRTNWAQGQFVTVTGVQDADTSDETVTITHRVSGSDPRYRALTPASATVNVNDNTGSGQPTTPTPTTPQSAAIWSATLTAADASPGLSNPANTNPGCARGPTQQTCSNALTSSSFTYETVSYSFADLYLQSGSLVVVLTRDIPDSFKQRLVLHVGSAQFAFKDATVATTQAFWTNSGLSWAVGDTVSLSIQGAATTPQESAAEWTATLTADVSADGQFHGCNHLADLDDCSGLLTDDDFTHKGTTYTIIAIYSAPGADQLFVQFDAVFPVALRQAFILNIDDVAYPLSQDRRTGTAQLTLTPAAALTWTDGQTVSLSLTRAPTTVQFAPFIVSAAVDEGDAISMTVFISPPLEQESSIGVTVTSDEADLNADYTITGLSQGRLTLPAGEGNTQFRVHAVADGITDGDKSVNIRLSAVPGAPYDLGDSSEAQLAITDTSLTPTGPPGAPADFALEPGDGRITASWDLPSSPRAAPQRRLTAPTGLTLYQDANDNGVVTWLPPLNNEGVTGWTVEYRPADGGDWTDVSPLGARVVAHINRSLHAAGGHRDRLTPGEDYEVRVRPLRNGAPGPWSDTLTRTFGPPADGEFVRGVSGYELRYTLAGLVGQTAAPRNAWTPGVDDPAEGWVKRLIDVEDASPHLIEGLANYKRYTVQARAWNAFGYGPWTGAEATTADPAANMLWSSGLFIGNLPNDGRGCDNSQSYKCNVVSTTPHPDHSNVRVVVAGSGALHSNSFNYYDRTYTVEEISLRNGVFRLRLDKDVPPGLRSGGYLTFHVWGRDVDPNPQPVTLTLPGDNSDFSTDAKLMEWTGVDGYWPQPNGPSPKVGITLYAHESPRDPQISLSVSPGNIAEGGSARVTVSVQPQETETLVTVTLGGDARYGEDYTVEGQTVHVLPGGTAIVSMATFLVSTQEGFRTFDINATRDAESEAAESITMNAVIQVDGNNLPDAVTAAWMRDSRASTSLTITENIGAPADIAISDVSSGAASVTWAAPAGDGPATTGYDVQYKETSSGAWLDAGSAVQGPDIWSAALNVKHFANLGSWGCVTLQNDNAKKCSAADTLTDNTVEVDGTTFTIVDLTLNRGTLRKTLVFSATPPSSYRNSHRFAKYLLYVDGEPFRFPPATGERPVWTAGHLDWKSGDMVQLRLAPLGSRDITGLTDGDIYDVRVRATSAQGAGPWAALDFPGAPGRPSRELGSGRLDVSWKVPSDTGNSAITGYDVQYRDTTSDTWVDAGRAGVEGKALWDARLSVHADAGGRLFGCDDFSTALLDCTAQLTDVNFEHQGAEYTIEIVGYRPRTGTLAIAFDTATTQALRDSVVLLVDDLIDDAAPLYLPLSAGNWPGAGRVVTLPGLDLGWSRDQLVRLRLAVLTHPITGLTDGATYEVRVRAVNDAGPGPWSPSTFGTPGAMRPGDSPWEARLTVKQEQSGVEGCNDGVSTARCSVHLSDNTFVHGGVEYRVEEVTVQHSVLFGTVVTNSLIVELDKTVPASLKTFVLLVDGRPFSLAAATYGTADTAHWDLLTLGWDALEWRVGEVVDLRLVPYQPPGVPTSIWLRPGYDEAIVTWTAPADTGHSAIHNYQVRYKPYTGGRDSWRTVGSDPGRHSQRISGLSPDTWYDVQVRAVNATAGPGEWSITHSVRTFAENNIILHTTRTTLTEGGPAATVTVTIPLAWTRDGWARLSVSPCSNAEQPEADCNADFEVQGFDPNFAEGGPASKTFTVRALNDVDAEPAEYFVISVSGTHFDDSDSNDNVGGWSEPLLFTIAENIGAPADLAISDVSGGAASVTWAAPAGDGPAPTGYDVQYKGASSANWRDAGRVGTGAIWSATLTARSMGNIVGCSNALAQTCTARLTDDDFVVNGTTYSIDRLYFVPMQTLSGTPIPPEIVIQLDRAITDDIRSLVLTVRGREFPLASATYRANDFPNRLNFRNPGLSWSDGDTVSLSLVPALSQEITGLTDGATYDVRVRAVYDSGPGPWSPTASSGGGQGSQGSQNSPGSGGGSPGSEGEQGAEPPTPGQLEPYNVQVTPGDGTLTVTWSVAPRDGFENDQIRHALRWSQVSGVWANPPDPSGGGREDGLSVEGGVTSYVITGLTNDVATGVFVRSFVGGSYSERSEHSSKWVRIKGDNTTPTAGGPPQQQQAAPKTYSVTPTATAAESWSALLTVTLSEAAPAGGVQFTVTAGYSGSADSADVGAIASPVTVPEGSDTLQIAVLTVDDAVDEDDETFTVTVAAVTQDWDPAGAGQDTATVTITDDDTAGVTVTPTTLSVAEDGSASYSVVLDSQPTDDVFVLPLSNDDGATFGALPLVFSPENWYTPQTITVSGADDADSNDESVGITHEASSGDPKYHRIPVSSVSVTVTDDDAQQQQQQTPADENAIWSATLTVHSTNHGRGCIDVGAGRCSGGVGLTDDDFSFEGTTYTVAKLFYGVNALNLYLDAPITDELKTLTLHVGDAQFPLSSALIPANKQQRANWPSSDPGWSAGDTVQVKLTRTAPAEPPARRRRSSSNNSRPPPSRSLRRRASLSRTTSRSPPETAR